MLTVVDAAYAGSAAASPVAANNVATATPMRRASRVVVCPFFLGPGKHWTSDIPRLTAEAAARFPQTRYHVTMPLGIDDLMLELLEKRVRFCVEHDYLCDSCQGTIRSGEPDAVTPEPLASPGAAHAAPALCSTCPYKGQPLPAGTHG